MRCRFCAVPSAEPVLRLGEQPFANSFLTEAEVRLIESGERTEPRLPLDLHLCEDCGLVQIADSPSPEELFSEYIYVSSTSELIHRHARGLADLFWRELSPPSAPLVVEIASNDGTVLARFRERGARVLGVEPAANVARLAVEAGIETSVEFFGRAAGERLRAERGPADLVLARHVFAHVPDPHGFLEGVRALLDPAGAFMIEAPYLEPLLRRTEFDTIYHEHLAYLSVRPLARIVAQHGLELFDLRPYEIHGGSLLYLIGWPGRRPVRSSVAEALAREEALGLAQRKSWQAFAQAVHELVGRLRALLIGLRARGARLAGYGAPAKGNTLLGVLGLGRRDIEFVVDRNPWKQGLYTPGSHIPVRPPEELLARRPDYALLLAWNFEAEVLEQQSEYRRRGGRFVRPLPSPEVIA